MFWRGRTVVQTESAAEGTGRTVLRKATVRLIPFLFVLYIVSFLDRVNVSFAALQMNEDLGLSDAVYGLGAGIFFIGYFVFEVPSNLILERVGARVWIARIMITWGIISTAMFLVTGPVSFYLLRFLLGVAEAGFFPGIILYLTYWFPARERAKAVALFMTAVAIAGVIGGPLSGALLSLDEVVFGLSGWHSCLSQRVSRRSSSGSRCWPSCPIAPPRPGGSPTRRGVGSRTPSRGRSSSRRRMARTHCARPSWTEDSGFSAACTSVPSRASMGSRFGCRRSLRSSLI